MRIERDGTWHCLFEQLGRPGRIAAGQAAALVESYTQTQYDVQISIPAGHTTTVTIILEELLQRKDYAVPFAIPFLPADDMALTIQVSDPSAGLEYLEIKTRTV